MLSHFESRAQKATFVAFSLALAALLAATIGSAATQIGSVWPGFVVWRNLVVPAIGARDWPGNRAGMPLRSSLVSVDGIRVRDAAEMRALVRARPPGTRITYEVEHDGQRIAVAVPSAVLSWGEVLPVYLPYWIDGFAFFAIGILVYYFRPALPAARAALALGSFLGGILLLASDVFSGFWLDAPYFALESLVPAALLHFALCFPEEKGIVRRHPWLQWAVYVGFLPLAALQIRGLFGDPRGHLAANDVAYAAIAFAGLVSIASLAHTFFASRSPLARQQAKVVLAGVVAAAFFPALGILDIVLLGADLPMNLLAPFYLVYPLSIAYAIARHDLFSVDRYLRLGVVYAALSLIVFLSYAALVLGGESLLGEGSLPRWITPVYLLVVLFVFDPLRAAIQGVVDRLFYRQAVSYRATVEATSRGLASVLDTGRVADMVLATLTDVMAIEWAAVAVLGPGAGEERLFARPEAKRPAVEARIAARPGWVTRVAARARALNRYASRGPAGTGGALDAAVLADFGGMLALPLRFEANPVGVLIVGEKKSGAFYGDEDLQLLGTLVNQCALALTNAHANEVVRRTQAELAEADRLAAVGELASAVAHGIRNPLAGIRAAAQVAREEIESESPIGENLDDIISEADRLELRVRSILDLARPGAAERVRGDLNGFVSAFAEAQRGRIPGSVHIDVDTDPRVPAVAFDPAQLTEALEVVVNNAVEAMSGSGAIRMCTRLEGNGDGSPRVAIAVSDSGPGMDAARLARVFELFYTTKPTGTGVGLAMAKRLVERQGGSMSAEAREGRGATFVVRLPVAQARPVAS